jgi:apolipoprotein N-acyltransferase
VTAGSFAAVLATAASAVGYGAVFPPLAWRPLAWIVLVPFLVAVRGGSLPRALGLAWLWTVAAAWAVGDWFPRAVSGYYAQPAWVGGAFFLGVATLMAGLQYMGFAAVYRALGRRFAARPDRWLGAAPPLVTAAAWVTAEAARAKLLSGNPWALAGYSQVGVAPLVQIAELTGVYGVSFALVAVNAALAELWLGRRQPERGPASRGLALALIVVAGTMLWGVVRLRALAPQAEASDSLVVVQGNLDLGSAWAPEFYGRNLQVYLGLTHQALAAEPAALVVWPENAMSFFLEDEPQYRRAIARVLGSTGVPAGVALLAGGPRVAEPGAARYQNAAFLLAPDGEISAVYEKEHLLPFAEYFPLASLASLQRRFGRVREFVAGARTAPLPTPIGRAGIVVCNEAFFPEVTARRVRDGAEVLVNLANDGWLDDAKFSAIALDMVTLRAVETRRWVVRASTSGPSGVIDPLGRVREQSAQASRAVLRGAVRPRDELTVYVRLGDAFAWGCVVVVLVALAVASQTGPTTEPTLAAPAASPPPGPASSCAPPVRSSSC